MYNEKKPLKVHVELSNKCNAMCPQCGRNYIDKNGVLKVKPTMQTGELVLQDYKKIFDDRFYDTYFFISNKTFLTRMWVKTCYSNFWRSNFPNL